MKKYLGYQQVALDQIDWNELYTHHSLTDHSFLENEYLVVPSTSEKKNDVIFQYRNKEFKEVHYPTINNKVAGKIKPRNIQQNMAIDLLKDSNIKVKVLKGVYGSGKDYLMINAALELIEKGKYQKIIYIRPNVTVKGLPDIGALPGTAEEKLEWTLGPIVDILGGKEGVQELIEKDNLEIIPLLYIRGRSFSDSIIYVSEGQNMTSEIVKLILGRVGENSELWINGDTHQTDKELFDKDNGLDLAIDTLKGNHLFGYVYLSITERSEVANLANLLDNINS